MNADQIKRAHEAADIDTNPETEAAVDALFHAIETGSVQVAWDGSAWAFSVGGVIVYRARESIFPH